MSKKQAEAQYILSVRPEWLALELAGQKVMEVRRTAPKRMPAGAVVWVYETRAGGGRGAVVARFRCPKVHTAFFGSMRMAQLGRLACLTRDELYLYGAGRRMLRFWEIEEIRALETPLPVQAFGLKSPPMSWATVQCAPDLPEV